MSPVQMLRALRAWVRFWLAFYVPHRHRCPYCGHRFRCEGLCGGLDTDDQACAACWPRLIALIQEREQTQPFESAASWHAWWHRLRVVPTRPGRPRR